jgi:hypothetical protein
MYDEHDAETLKKVKRYSKKKKDFGSAINSKYLSEEEMDDLFLGD